MPEVKAHLLKHAGPGIDAGRLSLRTGKAVLEIRPRVEWTKGEAVRWILEQVRVERPAASTLALYIGDDDTDEDAFRVLASAGVGIVVGTIATTLRPNFTWNRPRRSSSFSPC